MSKSHSKKKKNKFLKTEKKGILLNNHEKMHFISKNHKKKPFLKKNHRKMGISLKDRQEKHQQIFLNIANVEKKNENLVKHHENPPQNWSNIMKTPHKFR